MIAVQTHSGRDALAFAGDFSRLSEECLSGWPFFMLKKTDAQKAAFASALAVCVDTLHAVVVLDDGVVVGGTYGHAIGRNMGQVYDNIAKLRDPLRVYWIAQTTILPSHQGRGISHMIYNARDPWIIASGKYDAIAHVLVDRPDDHPLKPASHVPYGDMWGKRGYRYLDGMDVKLKYLDGADRPGRPTEKTLKLWMRDLS